MGRSRSCSIRTSCSDGVGTATRPPISRSSLHAMRSDTLSYDTSSRSFVDITADIENVVSGSTGLVNVFAPHATAGIAIIETGSGSEEDLAGAIDRLLPRD